MRNGHLKQELWRKTNRFSRKATENKYTTKLTPQIGTTDDKIIVTEKKTVKTHDTIDTPDDIYESVFLRMTTACYTEISFRTSATFSESSRCAEKHAVLCFWQNSKPTKIIDIQFYAFFSFSGSFGLKFRLFWKIHISFDSESLPLSNDVYHFELWWF